VQQLAAQAHLATFIPEAWLSRDEIYPSLLVSVASLVMVSLLTPAPAPEKWAPFTKATG
jgi:hypothetical protein